MEAIKPFINATTIGSLTSESTIPLVWDSLLRTITTTLLVGLVSELILYLHHIRSNAAAAQVAAVNGHRGGSLTSVWELITNRRTGAFRHQYPRRWLLSLLFLLTVLAFHASNFAISAIVQQKGDRTVLVSELPVKLWRVSTEEISADFGCINKQVTYRNGQSDLAIGLCHIFPIPTLFTRECMGIVRREAEGIYGIYHPRMLDFTGFRFPGTTFIGPILVSGNTLLFSSGTLPILEIDITEELVRNPFGDMVDGELTVRELRYFDISGVNMEGLGLCGSVNVSSRASISKLVGGLGFVDGKSRILDPSGNRTTMEVQTSASRTSIRIVIYIGVGALVGLLVSYVVGKVLEKISGATTSVSIIMTSAISQVGGSDCAMPAAVSNGHVTLAQVNTLENGRLHCGIYHLDDLPEAVEEDDKRVQTMLQQTKQGGDTYQGSGLTRNQVKD